MFRTKAAVVAAGALASLCLVTGAAGTASAQSPAAPGAVAVAAAESGVTTMSAARYPIAPGYSVNVRSGPGTKYRILYTLPVGASVPIYCQTPGETVTGPYGTSNLWDNIANGEFVSDAYVKTGSDGYVAPRCS